MLDIAIADAAIEARSRVLTIVREIRRIVNGAVEEPVEARCDGSAERFRVDLVLNAAAGSPVRDRGLTRGPFGCPLGITDGTGNEQIVDRRNLDFSLADR